MIQLLEIKNVDVKNKNTYRLKNINLTLRQGEKVALLGKSGSGKSSLISLSNGSLKPSEGEVKWQGQNINSLKQKQRIDIATLWQDLRLIEELNVGQNVNAGELGKHGILWALRNLIGNIDKKKTIHHLNSVGLSKELLYCNLNKLSGGQLQRVAIARLLRQSAKFMLVDEPLSNLDPATSDKIIELLLCPQKQLINVPETCLISLHRPEIIKHFTKVVGLYKGEIVLNKPVHKVNSADINLIYQA